MIEATMLDVSAGDQDVAMASSPYYHADAAMMDADYGQPETEEIDMDDGAAPEYEMADDDSYYQPYPQPAAPDADLVDVTVDPPPQDVAAPTIDMPLVVPAPLPEPSAPLDHLVSEPSPAPAFSAEPAPAPASVFAFSDVPPVDAFPLVPPQELPEHVSPLPLPASDLPAEHPETPAEPALPHAPVEPASFTDEVAAAVEDESPSHEMHSEHPYLEEAAVAPEPEPTAEAHTTSETIPGSESHAHDAPPPQDADASGHEATPAAESHVYEASAPGEVTLVEDATAYDLYEDDLDEGSDPSDEDLLVPAPTVSMTLQSDPAAHYVLFELAENASSSTTTFLFSDRPNLYYEPVSAVFEALRHVGGFPSNFEYDELALFAPQLNLTIAEDSKHASEASFSDFAMLHDSFGLEGPLQMQLQTISPRFIKRFNFLREEVAKMMRDPSATSQAAVEFEETEVTAPPEQQEQVVGYYESEDAAPAAHLEAQAEAHPVTDEPRAEEPHADPVDEAAEESGYAEDDEAELEYEDLPADGHQEYFATGPDFQAGHQDGEVAHADDDFAEDDEESDELAEPEGEPAAVADGLYEAPAQLEQDASEHGEPVHPEHDASEYGEHVAPLEHIASDHGDATAPGAETGDQVEDETSGEGDEDEDYSQEYAEYEGEYDEDDEAEDVEEHQLDELADDTNPPQAQDAYATNPDEVHEFLQGIISEVAEPEQSEEYHDDDYHEEELAQPPQIIDLTGELAATTNTAQSASQIADVEDSEGYSAVQSSYEGGEVYDLDADQEQGETQAYDADPDAVDAYEEDDQATLSSSDDRAAHTLPSISSKRSHDELLREDPGFDGDGLGEDDHDSKRARVE